MLCVLMAGKLGSEGMHESPPELSRGKGHRKARGKHGPVLERNRSKHGPLLERNRNRWRFLALTSCQRAAWLAAAPGLG